MNIHSISNKYHVEYVNLKNDLYNKYNLENLDESWIGKPRFILINIVKNENDQLVYSYKQQNELIKPCNKFISINGYDIWVGGKSLEYKMIINLDTEEIYDESLHINILGDSNKIFKWRDIQVSPDGKTLLVSGKYSVATNIPCTFRLYDISNLFIDGLIEISLTHIIGNGQLYEFDKKSQWLTYEFYDNNSLIKKTWDGINSEFQYTNEFITFK